MKVVAWTARVGVGVRHALLAALDLALPVICGGCGRAGRPWCPDCGSALGDLLYRDGPRLVRPDPCPPGLPGVVAAGPYADPLRSALVAFKDAERRDLAAVLAELLLASMRIAAGLLRAGPDNGLVVVPVPSSRASVRRRGDRPLELLVVRALRAARRQEGAVDDPGAWPDDLVLAPMARALVVRRRVSDQAGLTAVERSANLRGALVLPKRWAVVLRGRPVLLVDDVLTTGATLGEAARALRDGGVEDIACATVAATARRGGGLTLG